MDDNFSSRVKDVITYSKEEALRLGHDFIGTEHLLLGMLRDGGGKAINILNSLEIDLKSSAIDHSGSMAFAICLAASSSRGSTPPSQGTQCFFSRSSIFILSPLFCYLNYQINIYLISYPMVINNPPREFL